MRILNAIAVVVFLSVSASAQLPNMKDLKSKAAATGNVAYEAAKTAFNKAVKDIPFPYNSDKLELGDPKYKVAGVSVDEFMKKTVIPALVKVVELAPADKQVTVTGHASKRGTEEPSGSFMGNAALSKARAEAVVKYITANSNLPESRFKVVAAGSTELLAGVEPGSDKNCRVSIKME